MFWCQKVLPLVYDDSLSYYETLCKVVEYLNNVIKDENTLIDRADQLEAELAEVQKWIADYDTSFAEAVISSFLATMIMPGLDETGHIVFYIPASWHTINFGVTEYDVHIPGVDEFGRLVMMY